MNKYIKGFLKIAGCISVLAAIAGGIAFIAERIEEEKNKGKQLVHKPYGIYERFIKRPLDCFLSTGALIVLSPVFLVLMVVGAKEMKGNPFFTQERPGRIDPKTGSERTFKLIKFRTMTNEKDHLTGELLPDEQRLSNNWGRLLRKVSGDELGELINIIKGDMAIVGPRPLLVKYLPYYIAEERHRHDVRPGLTGLAQVNGRNNLEWEKRLKYDTEYARSITFSSDFKIILQTVKKVFKQEDVVTPGEFKMQSLDVERREKTGSYQT